MRNRTFTKLAVIGVASAMLVPAGASARPIGQAIAAGGGAGGTAQSIGAASQGRDGQGSIAQDLRAPDQVSPGVQPAQDLREPDQVAPATPTNTTPVPAAAPQWPAHAKALTPRSAPTSSSKSDGNAIDTGWLIGLGGLAVGCLAGLGLVYRIRVRNARQHAAA